MLKPNRKLAIRAGLRALTMPDGKKVLKHNQAEIDLIQDGSKLAEHRIKATTESRNITTRDLNTIVY